MKAPDLNDPRSAVAAAEHAANMLALHGSPELHAELAAAGIAHVDELRHRSPALWELLLVAGRRSDGSDLAAVALGLHGRR